MRIVAGAHKGRAITAPKGDKTRPTTDRVRESVFNKLTHAPWGVDLAGLRVMDLTALTMAQENQRPIQVFDMNQKGSLRRLLIGENVATLVKE